MMKLHIAILFSAAFVFASCKSTSTSSNNNNNNNGGNGTPANTMYITVGGKTDTLVASTTKNTNGGMTALSVVGNNTAMNGGCGFALENITDTGTYNIGVVSHIGAIVTGVTQMDYLYTDANGNLIQYDIPPNNTSSVGSLTITEISDTSIQATFSNCTLTLIPGSYPGPQTAVITSGTVNATIK